MEIAARNKQGTPEIDPINGYSRFLSAGVSFLTLSAVVVALGALNAKDEQCGNKWGRGALVQFPTVICTLLEIGLIAGIKFKRKNDLDFSTQQRCRSTAALVMCSVAATMNLITLVVLRANCK